MAAAASARAESQTTTNEQASKEGSLHEVDPALMNTVRSKDPSRTATSATGEGRNTAGEPVSPLLSLLC